MCLDCEACERVAATIIEPTEEPNEPYHICEACHERLMANALRPIEWFNLAKRHSWRQYLLHDDFYDNEGHAHQFDTDFEESECYAAPKLADVSSIPKLLLDYTITRWHFSDDLIQAWQTFTPLEILPVLTARFAATQNVAVRERVLEVAATAVRRDGANFVRYAWGEYPEAIPLPALAQASAQCLEANDGIGRIIVALSRLDAREKYELMFALSYFESPRALEWIEDNVFEPIGYNWGNLAAASRFDWSRATRWLELGRPFSLIALDALADIVRPRTFLLRKLEPKLHDPPTIVAFNEALLAYRERDTVPRVEHRVNFLLTEGCHLANGV